MITMPGPLQVPAIDNNNQLIVADAYVAACVAVAVVNYRAARRQQFVLLLFFLSGHLSDLSLCLCGYCQRGV